MLFELVAVIFGGVAAAGVVLMLRKLAPALPRWTVPAGAGLTMIAISVSLEYSWFERTSASLPEGVEVALTHDNRALWRPWTYLTPYVDSFIAIDSAGMRRNEAIEGQRMARLYVFGRWAQPQRVWVVFDCKTGRRADLGEGVALGEDGAVPDALWVASAADDPVARRACAGS